MLGRTRIHTRARGSGAGAGSTTTTDLQRILALSPSLLIWPANGAGWQGTSGGTLAASGQPLGLGVDLAALGGKTLSEWLASAPELVSNPGGPYVNTTGWTTAAPTTAVVSSGIVTLTRNSGGYYTQFYQTISGLTAGRLYFISVTVTGGSNGLGIHLGTGGVAPSAELFTGTALAGTYTVSFVATATSHSIGVGVQGNPAGSLTFSAVSMKELPGNHLRAGTWASPSDAARGTFQNNAINLDGVNDYYSLLNAISITESMTVVRAFKRASAGIGSWGIANATPTHYDATWFTDNQTYNQISGASLTTAANTGTGSFVLTSRKTGTSVSTRRNGTSIDAGVRAESAGSFTQIGRAGSFYNSGEISFLAVFPTELTGANLALVEQIAASTNGSVLA